MLALSLPEWVPPGIHVWLLPLGLTASIREADWYLLDGEERTKAKQFHHHTDRVRMVVTRAALRRQLGECVGCAPSALRFEYGLNNKPRLGQHPALAFNVSHSGEYALIAVSSSPTVVSVGIDIEQQSAGLELDDLSEYAFTAMERQFLGQCGRPDDESSSFNYLSAFFLNWVAKEAALKAVGVGISKHLQAVSIRSSANGHLAVEHNLPNWFPLHVCGLGAPDGYSAAVAWQMRGA